MVDKDVNMIRKPTVMASNMTNRGSFIVESEMFGSLGTVYESGKFNKIVIISISLNHS